MPIQRFPADGQKEVPMVKKAAQATPNRLLRAARTERGWTQQQVADRIEAPHALYITRWEKGTAFPSPYYLERLCQLFGKSVRELGLSQLPDEREVKPAPHAAAQFEPKPARAVPQALQHEPVPLQTDPKMRTLPYPRNPFFLGRDDMLAQLQRQMHAYQTTAASRPQA